MKMEKIKYYHSPRKDLTPTIKQIRNTNRQYIFKTLHDVKPFFEKKPFNNDIEFNKIIFS
jgi:hypothetical protein